ncbi:MAG: hypothetical protein C4337_05905, partial [Armatimonadota bacterium]
MNALFRYEHSFKGNSAAMGFTQLSKFTHGLESAMEVLRQDQRPLTPELTSLLLQAVDVIRALLECTRTEGDVGECEVMLHQVSQALGGTPLASHALTTPQSQTSASAPAAPQAPSYRLTYQPAPTLSAEHDPLSLWNACYGTWEMVVSTPFEPAILRAILEPTAEGAQVDMTSPESDAIPPSPSLDRTETTAMQSSNPSSSQAPSPTPSSPLKAETQSIRVATEKIDALFNLVSEIVIAQSMLTTAQTTETDERLQHAITHMERHVRELHLLDAPPQAPGLSPG